MSIILNRESSYPELVVEVPRQSSWHVPIGSYSGSVRSVKLINRFAGGSNIPLVRIVFNVIVSGSNLDYLAKIDLKLDLTEGSDLWNVVCRLLGRQVLQDHSDEKLDLQILLGFCCDLEIDHVLDHAERHSFPFVIVTNVQAPGTLIRRSETNLTES